MIIIVNSKKINSIENQEMVYSITKKQWRKTMQKELKSKKDNKSLLEIIDLMKTLLTDKEFINKIDGWIKDGRVTKREIEDKKLAFEKEKLVLEKDKESTKEDKWYNANLKIYYVKLCLSSLIAFGIMYLGYIKILEPAYLVSLLSIIVASLYGQPKKE